MASYILLIPTVNLPDLVNFLILTKTYIRYILVYTNRGYTMTVRAREVGNSLVVTIPKESINELNIKKGDLFDVMVNRDNLCFVPKKKKLKGEVFLENYYNKSFDEIEAWGYEDISTGVAIGDEAW